MMIDVLAAGVVAGLKLAVSFLGRPAPLRLGLSLVPLGSGLMTHDLAIGSTLTAKLAPTDAAGNALPLPPGLAWASSDPGTLTVTPSADGSTAVVEAVKLGTASVTVTAGGVTESADVTVTAGALAHLGLTLVGGVVLNTPAANP